MGDQTTTDLAERIETVLVRSLAAAPAPLVRLLAGRLTVREGQRLDPLAQTALRLERFSGGVRPEPVETVRERRRRDARVFAGERIEVAEVRDLELPGPAGPIGARLYRPAGLATPAPLIVYYHGGGHVICDLDTQDRKSVV